MKVKLTQYEAAHKKVLSKFHASNDNKHIYKCNYYNSKIAKLKGIIKLKSELTDEHEIIIEKKNHGNQIKRNQN